ncbi:MAG: DUF134 domain-containing protein [Christensenella sp.]|nr:DUF134 domain-containing protein [Christensenella sp.]
MARPRKCRRVCSMPETSNFYAGSSAPEADSLSPLVMSVEEFMAIRLIDFENLTQEECAQRMSVARPTVQRIYDEARKKLASFLIEGRDLRIAGGNYEVCDGRAGRPCCGKACPRRHAHGTRQSAE